MTLADWIARCSEELTAHDVFFGHGTDNAGDEAAWLVLAASNNLADGSFDDWGREVEAQTAHDIEALLKERISSEKPLAYLLGEAWFCGHRFFVNEQVLVPRSPVAELIQSHYLPWVQAEPLDRMLDLCTGSGCIVIASALEIAGLKVDASDISVGALRVAEKNTVAHGVGDRVQLIQSDLFDGLQGRRYPLIVSNPPYVSAGQYENLPAEYLSEPEIGLVTGLSGLEIPLRILRDAPEYLTPDGVLICEVGENETLLQSVLPELPLVWLEFDHGAGGVFTISRQTLGEHQAMVAEGMEKLSGVT
jgi:ribosomal protein L3 glutamine methyltransferase